MGGRHSDQRVALVTGGAAATSAKWDGGEGIVYAYGGTVAAAFQFSPDNGTTWIPVSYYGQGADDSSGNTQINFAAAGMAYFKLPACRIRMAAGWTSGEAVAVSV